MSVRGGVQPWRAPKAIGRVRALTAATVACGALASLGVWGAQAPRAFARSASAARTISLNESGSLRLIGKHGFTLQERGQASGTIVGTIYVRLTAVSSSRVTAEVSIYPRGGSVTGNGAASYRMAGATSSFSGSMSIGRGTGSYAHAHGSGLSFSGTIQRSNDAVTVHVSGRLSD
jgi:hypothetical protein